MNVRLSEDHDEVSYLLMDRRVESDRKREVDLGVSGAVTGVRSGSGHPLNTRVDQQLEDIVVTLKWRERMQSAGGGSLVRRKGSGFEETQLCVLSPSLGVVSGTSR